jgi:RNA polymerase sigma factor (sigma-70 family)
MLHRRQSDERLVALARAGHETAFAAIVERYRPQLLALARRLNSDGTAEDLVQQAFLHAFAALRSGTEVDHLRGWLHQILRHVASAAHTRARAQNVLDVPRASGDALADTAEQHLLAVAALALVADLPARQRDALVGTAIQGRTRAEVASSMGLSEGAVRALVHRARARLRSTISVVVPYPVARWLAGARTEVVGSGRVAELAAGGGPASAGGLALKVGAAVTAGVMAAAVISSHSLVGHHARPRKDPDFTRLAAGATAGHDATRARAVDPTPVALADVVAGEPDATPATGRKRTARTVAAVSSTPRFEGRPQGARWRRSRQDGASASVRERRVRRSASDHPARQHPAHRHSGPAAAGTGRRPAPAPPPAMTTVPASPDTGTVPLEADSAPSGGGRTRSGWHRGDGGQSQTQDGGSGAAGLAVPGPSSRDGTPQLEASAGGDGQAYAASFADRGENGNVPNGATGRTDGEMRSAPGPSGGSPSERSGSGIDGQAPTGSGPTGVQASPGDIGGQAPTTSATGGGEQALAARRDASRPDASGGGAGGQSVSTGATTPDGATGSSDPTSPPVGPTSAAGSAGTAASSGGGAHDGSGSGGDPATQAAAAPGVGGSPSSASGPGTSGSSGG